jgi:tetratricopeptide (TPR) repeat protein
MAAFLQDRAVTYSELVARQADKGLPDSEHKDVWKGLPSAAAYFADKASKIFSEAGNKQGEASVVVTYAGIALKGKKLQEAEELAKKALKQFQELSDGVGEAAAYYMLYEIRVKDDLADAAVESLDAIVTCYQKLPDANSNLGASLLLSAELQRLQGDLQDAVVRAGEAAQYFHDAVDGNNKGQAVLSMAKSFFAAEQYDDTTEAASGAVELFKGARNKSGQAQALALLAECCGKGGKNPEAVYRLEEAAFLYRQVKDKKKEAITLTSLSQLQLRMIDSGTGGPPMKEPLRHSSRAVQLFNESGGSSSREAAEANFTAGKANLSEGDDEEAAMYATTSREIYEKLGNRSGEAAATALLAQICYKVKDKEKGMALSQRALDLAQEVGDQDLMVLAGNLVENQGKAKEVSMIELTDIDIIWKAVRLARFDEFEGRRARYKAVGGGSAAIQDQATLPQGVVAKRDEQKVQYVIRWQRVANLNLAAMPQPPPVSSKKP